MRNTTIIQNCWNTIKNTHEKKLNDNFQVLLNIQPYLNYFKLTPVSFKTNLITTSLNTKIEPHFENVTNNIIFELKNSIYSKSKLTHTKHWAEKLLKFFEIQHKNLKQRTSQKRPPNIDNTINILHILTFLIEYGIYLNDLRYLNVTLKVLDVNWVFNPNNIEHNLKKNKSNFKLGLLQFNLILISEFWLQTLEESIKNNE
jgi:hypothetical protein